MIRLIVKQIAEFEPDENGQPGEYMSTMDGYDIDYYWCDQCEEDWTADEWEAAKVHKCEVSND